MGKKTRKIRHKKSRDKAKILTRHGADEDPHSGPSGEEGAPPGADPSARAEAECRAAWPDDCTGSKGEHDPNWKRDRVN
jgi:hypothetical protein